MNKAFATLEELKAGRLKKPEKPGGAPKSADELDKIWRARTNPASQINHLLSMRNTTLLPKRNTWRLVEEGRSRALQKMLASKNALVSAVTDTTALKITLTRQ